ncbi:DUF881 domain-containing protein [Gracilibacillus oryzae]|uniref:DUF881 domain-containing protein n=1 Tax=Gracilibacillus oryzae TaxID=1672701 RepID=A0A7C8L078_9BACI|nr:DUF881 domain-containing protein [Gracilibacillus oryzae]KAB8138655.1 DUF881 domain-containing protein [Gracilibacillus oryzae]
MIISNKGKIWISIICLIVGFMIAILFETKQSTELRDTRDLWEIRTALQKEQEIQQNIYNEIAASEVLLQEYENQPERQQLESLKESIENLKEQAGLTVIEGEGVVITLQPIFQEYDEYQIYPELTADLLQFLINQLNDYGATEIAVGQERLINITPIRNVNGRVYVNNSPIGDLPVKVHVITDDPTRLINHIEVSESIDYFALENIELKTKQVSALVLPKYDQTINLEGLEITESLEEGDI